MAVAGESAGTGGHPPSGAPRGRGRGQPDAPLPASAPRGRRGADLPRGLMVFSAASFSLEPPLDMSAAMEKALAREESWGLGDAVNSMAPRTRSGPGTGLAEAPSSFPEGDKDRNAAQSFRVQPQRGRGLRGSPSRPPESATPASALADREAPEPQSLRTGRRAGHGLGSTRRAGTGARCRTTGCAAGDGHPLRKARGSRSAPSASFLPLPRGGQPEGPQPQGARERARQQGAGSPRSAAPRTLRRALAAPRLNLLAAPVPAARSQSAPPHVTASWSRRRGRGRRARGRARPGRSARVASRRTRRKAGTLWEKGCHHPADGARGRCALSRGGIFSRPKIREPGRGAARAPSPEGDGSSGRVPGTKMSLPGAQSPKRTFGNAE